MADLFGTLSYMVKCFSYSNGVEMLFSNTPERHISKTTSPLVKKLKKHKSHGQADLRKRLQQIIVDHDCRPVGPQSKRRKRHLPLTLYVFTYSDWRPDWSKSMDDKLERSNPLPLMKLGPVWIQFITFGNHQVDPRSAEWLRSKHDPNK